MRHDARKSTVHTGSCPLSSVIAVICVKSVTYVSQFNAAELYNCRGNSQQIPCRKS